MANMDSYEQQHLRDLAIIEQKIRAIYEQYASEAALLGDVIGELGEELLSFDKYPITKARVEQLLQDMHDRLLYTVVDGVNSQWTLANNKNNELCRRVFGDAIKHLTLQQERRYFRNNESARDAFLARKEGGLSLSDRVWYYTKVYKSEIEMGLDVGIRSGMSASEMTRELRSYLRNPDKLFRRVRDQHGDLVLSRRAKEYHPGQGVYRSSYMNARRLAVTETNMAYRSADYERYQQLDFVVGIEVHLSGNHTCKGVKGQYYDICDDLKGKYPKDFKFTGWHPHCRCYVTTILKTPEEMARDNERIMMGEKPGSESSSAILVPSSDFTKYLIKRREIARTSYTVPYFVKDNKKYIPDIVKDAYGSATAYSSFAEYEEAMKFNKRQVLSKELRKNIRELNKVMSVQQGKIMNATEADGGKVNPNHSKKNSDELGYRHNCQTCTMAYELRRRGFDVEARPNPKVGDTIYREYDVSLAVIGGWRYRYLNKDGTPASFDSSGIGFLTDTFSHKYNYIKSVIDKPGRYEVNVKWKNLDYGHVFIIEKTKDDDIFWYDPQTGKKQGYFRDYIKKMEADNIEIMRIDDKLINVKLASCFRKKAKKRTNKKKTK